MGQMSDLPTLNLHCGYHKTGSSYLQSALAANREFLQDHGVLYPTHASDHQAARGQATAGNGQEFALALRDLHESKVERTLQRLIEECISSGSDSILLSAEAFFHTFGLKPQALHLLSEVARNAGFERIRLLVFVREPASHALSVYRHRAKGKYLGPPEDWVESGYETLDLMGNFLDELDSVDGLECTFRRYGDQEVLNNAFYVDWLQIPTPPKRPVGRVRESLRLSEILAIQAMEQAQPGCALDLAMAFQSLNRGDRASDDALLQSTICRVAKRLEKWTVQIRKIDDRLPPIKETMTEWDQEYFQAETLKPCQPSITLSGAQIVCMGVVLFERNAFRPKLERMIKNLVPNPVINFLHKKW